MNLFIVALVLKLLKIGSNASDTKHISIVNFLIFLILNHCLIRIEVKTPWPNNHIVKS
jgi:hypothetical protein